MQLSQVVDTTVTSAFKSASWKSDFRSHARDQFKSLTPEERAAGFDRFMDLPKNAAAVYRVATHHKGLVRRTTYEENQVALRALRIARHLCSVHGEPITDSIAVGVSRSLRFYGCVVPYNTLLLKIFRDFSSLGFSF